MSNIKLTGNTWDTSGIYDDAQGKTQKAINADSATKAGNFPELTAGTAQQLIGNEGVVDKIPYAFRKSGGGVTVGTREVDKLVGGTVAWNQLLPSLNSTDWRPEANVTATYSDGVAEVSSTVAGNGIMTYEYLSVKQHVYFMRFEYNGTAGTQAAISIAGVSGGGITKEIATSNVWENGSLVFKPAEDKTARIYLFARVNAYSGLKFRNVVFCDLTQMFGSTIADYILSLETAHTGAGVAFFRSLFPKSYYAYNAGTLMSVRPSSHEMILFNQWDEVWENGYINDNNGGNHTGANWIRSKNYIRIIPNAIYYCKCGKTANTDFYFYDSNKSYLGYSTGGHLTLYDSNQTFTTPANAAYMRFYMSDTYGSTYNNDICINISDPDKNGTYESYKKCSYPLDSNLELRGIPKLDADHKLYYDGDVYESNGKVTRKYGSVDLGTATWTYDASTFGGAFYTDISDANFANTGNGICSKYVTVFAGTDVTNGDKVIYCKNNGSRVWLKDSAYSDASTFKTSLSGVYFVYEAISTAASADLYTEIQIVEPYGTEEYVDAGVTAATPTRDVAIPVGHETFYPEDLVGKIEDLGEDVSDLESKFVITTGKNLLDTSKCVNGYLNTNGTIHSNPSGGDWKTTDFIAVEPGEKIVSSHTSNSTGLRATMGMYFFLNYSENKTIIGEQLNSASEPYTIPENVKYIRFSYHSSTGSSQMVEKGTSRTPYEAYAMYDLFKTTDYTRSAFVMPNKLSGLKWCVFGDSLTEKNSKAALSYHDYIAQDLNLEIYNLGASGTGYARGDNGSFSVRMQYIDPNYFDFLTIFGSLNDAGSGLDIGEPTDSTTSTICGHINITLNAYYTQAPFKPIGLITPCPWKTVPPDNTWGQDYADAIIEIGKLRGIPVLDLFRSSGIRPWAGSDYITEYYTENGVADDGVHPNSKGHKMFLYPQIKQFVLQLIQGLST